MNFFDLLKIKRFNVFSNQQLFNNKEYYNYFFYKGFSRPFALFLETVNICQNDCIFCAHQYMTRKRQIMSMELFKKIINDYNELGGGVIGFTPMIGDVFIDKFLVERLRYLEQFIKERKIRIFLTTNAMGFDRYSTDDLKKILNFVEGIRISVYGIDEEEHYKVTRRNNYDKFISNLKLFCKLLRNNTQVVFGFRLLHNRSNNELESWMINNFGRKFSYGTITSYANWGNTLDTTRKLPYNGTWIPVKENLGQCFIPAFAGQIYSNGNFSFCPCCDYDCNKELSLGNIHNNSIKRLYNRNYTQKLWNFEKKMPEFCRFCTFFLPEARWSDLIKSCNDPMQWI